MRCFSARPALVKSLSKISALECAGAWCSIKRTRCGIEEEKNAVQAFTNASNQPPAGMHFMNAAAGVRRWQRASSMLRRRAGKSGSTAAADERSRYCRRQQAQCCRHVPCTSVICGLRERFELICWAPPLPAQQPRDREMSRANAAAGAQASQRIDCCGCLLRYQKLSRMRLQERVAGREAAGKELRGVAIREGETGAGL